MWYCVCVIWCLCASVSVWFLHLCVLPWDEGGGCVYMCIYIWFCVCVHAFVCMWIYVFVCACFFVCARMPGYLASLRLLKIHYKVTSAQPETNDGWMKGSAGAWLGLVLACAGDTYIHIHTCTHTHIHTHSKRTHTHTYTLFNPLAEHCRYTELSNKGLNS